MSACRFFCFLVLFGLLSCARAGQRNLSPGKAAPRGPPPGQKDHHDPMELCGGNGAPTSGDLWGDLKFGSEIRGQTGGVYTVTVSESRRLSESKQESKLRNVSGESRVTAEKFVLGIDCIRKTLIYFTVNK